MKRFIRFQLLLVLASAMVLPALPQTQGGVEILLAKARSLELRGRIDLAAQNWQKVLLVNPSQTEALAGLARAAKENGQADQERTYLDRLRKINPHDPEIAAVEALHVFTPEERNRLDEAGRLAMQHKPDEAMKIYRQVLGDQQPPPGKWSEPFYETEAESTGGRERAIAQLRQLCAQNPDVEAYRLWLASLLTYDPKTRMEGLQIFASIQDPATAEQARAPWRQALLWEKDNPDVLAPMEAYLQRYPDPDLQPIVAALRAKQQQNIADAEKAVGFKALRDKDVGTAEARFTAVLRQSPNDANATIGLGYVRLDQKRFSDALSLFERARTLAPQRQDARDGYQTAQFSLAMQRGADAQRQNRPQDAVMAFQDALSLRPVDTGALLGLANALALERNFPGAEAKFQQVLDRDPNNAEAIAGLGFVRLDEGRFDDAARLLANAHRLDPSRKDVNQGYDNAKFWGIMNQAAAALKQNQVPGAIAAYQQALALNPNNKDALVGFANASLRANDFPTAARTYYRLAASNPLDESSWLGLIHAQMGENAPQAAITTVQRIPPAVRQRMETRSDFLSELALVYYEANQPEVGDRFLNRALVLAGRSDSEDALSLRLEIAGRFMDQDQAGRAIAIYREATRSHPDDPSGWEGLVGAYTRLGIASDAIAAVRSMPQSSYDAAMKNTGFLNSVAVLYSTQGECAEAEHYLLRSLAMDRSKGHQSAQGTELQLADVWMRERNYDGARSLYNKVALMNPGDANAWRGYLVALHQQHADRTLVSEIPNIPAPVRTQLETDPSFLILEASAYSNSQRNPEALRLLEQARARYANQNQPSPAALDIQTAWTMLAVSPDTPGLGDLLLNDKRRTDLTMKEHEALEAIYADWSVRRAEQAFPKKPELAFSILADAGLEYPKDRDIHAELASLYLRKHDKQKALDLFETWGMAGAQAGDYRVAAGAALSAHKFDLANQYVRRGLAQFPRDPGLMHMMARQDIARGDYDEGEQELKSALLAVQDQDTSAPEMAPVLPDADSTAAKESALTAQTNSTNAAASASSTPPCKTEASSGTTNEVRIGPASLVFSVSHEHRPHLYYAALQEPAQTQQPEPPPQSQSAPPPQPLQNAQQPPLAQQPPQDSQQQPPPPPSQSLQSQQQQQQMEDEVEVVNDRNTPIVNVGTVGSGRIGDPGIDQLIVADSLLGSAYVVSNSVKFGVEAHGIYAFSGTPDGSSQLMFGTLPAGALFGSQSKEGVSGLVQLSTNTFGLAFGNTPQGFAVHNVIAGIRYRPADQWFSVEAVRNSVKDSLLSYAGSDDPGTGLRWGGVVANTGTLRLDSAPPPSNSVYRAVGAYASGSYSFLQGLNVPDNWGVSGNAGLYWQVVSGLTVGGNANAMHYGKNLKYFSFGQGGYFSPQQYYLASIPISWYARHPRFEYKVRFSGGIQYLHEDATPYYPVLPGLATVKQGTYAADSSTVPNYDADIRMGYRVAPHVYFGIFATANNASNYYSQSAGFSLKFLVDPIPTSTDLKVNSIPDWEGTQPFSVQ
jgi:cellulose synthase operon protein C